jgi:hypothetical protein
LPEVQVSVSILGEAYCAVPLHEGPAHAHPDHHSNADQDDLPVRLLDAVPAGYRFQVCKCGTDHHSIAPVERRPSASRLSHDLDARCPADGHPDLLDAELALASNANRRLAGSCHGQGSEYPSDVPLQL